MIRPAKNVDIFRLVELMQEMNAASKYSIVDEVDEAAAHRLLAQCIQRHGHKHDGGAFVMVSTVEGGEIEGFMVGILDRVYHIGKKLTANDVFLYCSPRADKTAMQELVDDYINWAEANTKVATIKLSWTDAVRGAARMGKVYQRRGFTKIGEIYERTKESEVQEMAA